MIKSVSIIHALNDTADKDLILLFTFLKKLHLKGLLGKGKYRLYFMFSLGDCGTASPVLYINQIVLFFLCTAEQSMEQPLLGLHS